MSWYERIDRGALDHATTVRDLIDKWPALSAGFQLRDAVAAQIEGAAASWH
ncbi:hypothetical protein IAE22_33790 [Bacillus sp. S34]|nr:hypothetical protein [Bacillus sp. S34]